MFLEPGGRRRPGIYKHFLGPVLQVPAGEEGGPSRLINLLKEEEREEDVERKKEDGDDEKDMEGKRRNEEDMQDSLVVEDGMMVKYPLIPFATCIPPLQLLLFGSFQQEEVKQPYCRDAQRPKNMNYLVHHRH